MEFSQKNEFEADSLGFVLACKAGYDSRAMDMLVQRLIFIQKKSYLIRNSNYNSNSVMPTTHPLGEDRLDKIKMLENDNVGDLYPNGKDRFEKIKRLAEFEFLKLLDESFDIHTTISFSLKKYLSTGEDVYLPTLVRGIRKAILLAPNLKKEGFMITQFSQRESMFEKKENLLHHLYYEYPDSAEVAVMHDKAVVDFNKVPFYSFDQAFKYFSKVAIEAGYEEPLLDKALYYGIKSTPGRTALNTYLKNSNNLYYDYATALKFGKINENLSKGEEVVLIGGFHKRTYKKNWVYSKSIKEFEGRHEFLSDLRVHYQKHELDYKLYYYEDFIQQNELGKHLSTIEQLIYGGYAYSMFEYDPRLYYAFKKANISSLEYLRIDAYTIRKQLRNWIFMVPPLTPLGALILLKAPYLLSPYFNVSIYYQIRLFEDAWSGGATRKIRYMPMSKRRAKKIIYKTHKKVRKWQAQGS